MAYWEQHNFPIIVTLPGNIYGPFDNFDLENAHVIPALVRKFVETVDDVQNRVVVWGTGKPTRDFVYVGDVAEGIMRAAEVCDEPELLNLSVGREISIREIVETLTELTGFAGDVIWDTTRPDGQPRRVFDISKAKRKLGFETPTGLRDGLRLTIKHATERAM